MGYSDLLRLLLCGDPIRPMLNLTSGLNVQKKEKVRKRDRKTQTIVSYLFDDEPREQWFKNEAD